ncbi:MAG: cation:H+ antiporter [Candidatus Diapherotrites archaeon]|nr:cation:H+ antiporter [Candidatus Diapherotrites archaeon]MDN5366909.1 cation:H+ antiporter [Candidatus Diapherotrites archaeon]
MLLDAVILVAGIALLVWGARKAISAAVDIANATGIDRYGVGATIVATLTSLPELAVAVMAVMDGRPEIATGTAVGSVIGLFLLSFGVLGLMTTVRFGKERRREMLWAAIITSWVTILLVLFRKIPAVLGLLLVLLYVGYMHLVREGRISSLKRRAGGRKVWMATLLLVISTAVVFAGAELVVRGSEGIARAMGIPEFFIAFFIVALGTNMPELSVEIAAVRARETGIAIGDILGSAVADLTLVLGTAALVGALSGHTIVFNGTTGIVAAMMLGASLVGLKLSREEVITKWEALSLIILYILVVWAELVSGSV